MVEFRNIEAFIDYMEDGKPRIVKFIYHGKDIVAVVEELK